MKPVTILAPYNNEEGEQLEYFSGFLTGGSYAMFVSQDYGKPLVFVKVEPTSDPNVYLKVTRWFELGNTKEVEWSEAFIIERLTYILENMTAYEFVSKVLLHIPEEFGFDDALIPNLIKQSIK